MQVAIDGENASKGPVESFMARMVVAAQQEKAGIVSSAHGLDNTDVSSFQVVLLSCQRMTASMVSARIREC